MPTDAPGAGRSGPAVLVIAILLAACGSSPATPAVADGAAASSPSASPAAERCVEETLEHTEHDAVVGADLAAWQIEDLLPPPLRTAGLHSDQSTILLDGEPVGEVAVKEVEPNIFVATGISYCVPADLELARTNATEEFGGAWWLLEATPALGLPDDVDVRLTVLGDRIDGSGPCNLHNADLAAGPEGALRLSHVFFNEAGCGDQIDSASERQYRDLLGSVDRWRIDAGELVLEGPEGTLRYTSDPP